MGRTEKLPDKEYEIMKEWKGEVNLINHSKNLSSAHILRIMLVQMGDKKHKIGLIYWKSL